MAAWDERLSVITRAHAGALIRRDAQPVVALSGARLPDVGALGAVSERRRLRLPRPAAGRDGVRLRRAGGRARAHRPRGRAAVPRGRRPALVASGRAAAACGLDSPTTSPGCRTSSITTCASRATRRCSTRRRRSSTMRQLDAARARGLRPAERVRARRATVYEHCVRALDKACTAGEHGLPLIGIGDWNDGMNRVGVDGKGESVWLAWFLVRTLGLFAVHAERRRDAGAAAVRVSGPTRTPPPSRRNGVGRRLVSPRVLRRRHAARLRSRARSAASIRSPRAGASSPAPATRQRQRLAMRSLEEHLVREDARLLMLLTPPFDVTPLDPGLHQGLPAGRARERRAVHPCRALGRARHRAPSATAIGPSSSSR